MDLICIICNNPTVESEPDYTDIQYYLEASDPKEETSFKAIICPGCAEDEVNNDNITIVHEILANVKIFRQRHEDAIAIPPDVLKFTTEPTGRANTLNKILKAYDS